MYIDVTKPTTQLLTRNAVTLSPPPQLHYHEEKKIEQTDIEKSEKKKKKKKKKTLETVDLEEERLLYVQVREILEQSCSSCSGEKPQTLHEG
jgi:hypothetical protein